MIFVSHLKMNENSIQNKTKRNNKKKIQCIFKKRQIRIDVDKKKIDRQIDRGFLETKQRIPHEQNEHQHQTSKKNPFDENNNSESSFQNLENRKILLAAIKTKFKRK